MTDDYRKKLDANKRPHPAHPRGTIELVCLSCQRPFLSVDRACNRRCPTCQRQGDGITSNGAIGGAWKRARAGA